YALWAFCGIGGLPHIGVRNGHGSAGCGRLADVRKDDTDSVTAFVDYAPAIGKGGLGHHTLLMIHRFWLYSDGSLYTSFCFGAVPQIKKFNSLIQLPAAVDSAGSLSGLMIERVIPVHPVQQCLDGSGDDVAVLADPEHSLALVNLEFHITHRCHIRARTYRVFMVIHDLHGLAQMLADGMGSGINGSITGTGKRHRTLLVTDMDFDIHPLRILTDFTAVITERRINRKIFLLERSEEHTSELQSRENLVCRLL